MSEIWECPKCQKQYPLKKDEAGLKKYFCKECRAELRLIPKAVPVQPRKTGAFQALLTDAPDDVKNAFMAEKTVIAEKYLLGKKIGQGGMGAIYKGWDTVLKRHVAVKMILHSMLDSSTKYGSKDSSLSRFAIEAQTAAKLLHPNILQVFDVGRHENDYFIIMEYVDGCNLDEYVESKYRHTHNTADHGKFRMHLPSRDEITDFLAMMVKVIRAIDYAHKSNIIHRDIKPANILLAKDKEGNLIPKVSDFGLAKEVTSTKKLTVEGTVVGTPVYMSPEQATAGKLDRRSDIFSLGSVLYRLCTGIDPFHGKSSLDVMKAVVNKEPVAPGKINRNINRDIEVIILKALEKDPARRYATAEELADDMEKSLRGEPITARPASITYKVTRNIKRNKTAYAGMGIATAVLIAVSIWLWIGTINRQKTAKEYLDKAGESYKKMDWAEAKIYYSKYFTLVREDKTAKQMLEECEMMLEKDAEDAKRTAEAREKERLELTKKNMAFAEAKEKEKQASEEAQTAWLYANQTFNEFYRENSNMEKTWKQINEAEAMLDSSLKKFPTSMGYFYRAMIHKEKNKLNDAADDLTMALELNPCLDIAYIMRGVIFFEQYREKYMMSRERVSVIESRVLSEELAKKASNDFNRINPESKIPEQYEVYKTIFAAMRMLYDMQADKCAEMLENAYEKYGHEEILYWLAITYVMKDTRKAEEYVEKVIEMKPKHAKAYHLRGFIMEAGNDLDAAIEDYSMAVTINPYFARAYSSRGCAHLKNGEKDRAIQDLTKAVELCPGDSRYYLNRGVAYFEKGILIDAMEDFTKAILINPRYVDAWVNRGNAQYKSGNLQKAIDDYSNALLVDPDDVGAHSNRAIAEFDKGDFAAAINDYSEIIRIVPEDAMSYGNRGFVLYKAGRLKEALADFEKAVELKPDLESQVKTFMEDIKNRLKE